LIAQQNLDEEGVVQPGCWAVPVAIAELRTSFSPRLAGANSGHVRFLAKLDDPLPPILVHRSTMEVVDGAHRLRAAELRGETTVAVDFFDGSAEDAFLLSVKLNVTHGLPLSNADRITAAARIITTNPDWSDRRIAAASGLSAKTVATARARSTAPSAQLNGRVGRDGRVRPMDAAHGRQRAAQLIGDIPNASLRQIAAGAGISLSTAKDVRDRVRLGLDPVLSRQRGAQPADDDTEPDFAVAHVHEAPYTDPVALLAGLRQDPSLRFNETGRALLRLLSAHFGDDADWGRYVASVPAHCGERMARIARQCADAWTHFAQQVESSGHGRAS
jgi:ParB-like chromosome segregation protein Spo0J